MWFIQLPESYRENCSTSIPCCGAMERHSSTLGLDFKKCWGFPSWFMLLLCKNEHQRGFTRGSSGLSFAVTSHNESLDQFRVEGSLANREQLTRKKETKKERNKQTPTLFHSSITVSNLYLTRIVTASIKSKAVRSSYYFQGPSSVQDPGGRGRGERLL